MKDNPLTRRLINKWRSRNAKPRIVIDAVDILNAQYDRVRQHYSLMVHVPIAGLIAGALMHGANTGRAWPAHRKGNYTR